MINSNSGRIATTFAESLAVKNKKLVVKPTTVLNTLVGLSVAAGDFSVKTREDLEAWSHMLSHVTEGTIDNPSRHSLELDALIKQIGDLVKSHVAYAKNIVVPHVVELAKAIEEYRQTAKPRDPSEDFEIRVIKIPSLLKDSSFLDSLRFYQDKTILNPDKELTLGVKTEEELAQMILVGSNKTDKLVLEWYSAQVPGTLSRIWNGFFCTSGNVGYDHDAVYGYEGIAKLNNFERANYALGFYLIARHIFENVQDSNMPLETYKDVVAQYRDYAGSVVMDALKKTAFSIKTKVLILQNDTYRKVLKVNGEIYDEWLETGGTPETLLGLHISGDSAVTVSMIEGKVAEYKRRWESYLSFSRVSQGNKFFDDFKTAVLSMYQRSFTNQDDIEKDYIAKTPNFVEDSVKKVQDYLNTLKVSETENSSQLALTLIGKFRFCYNSSYQILSDMEEASRVNPNIDPREAALLAVINYVSDYVANQITLTNV